MRWKKKEGRKGREINGKGGREGWREGDGKGEMMQGKGNRCVIKGYCGMEGERGKKERDK